MLESLRAVQTFLDAHADKLDGVVKTGARQRLSDAIAALQGHAKTPRGKPTVENRWPWPLVRTTALAEGERRCRSHGCPRRWPICKRALS